MKIALIGFGAMAQYVVDQLAGSQTDIAAVIVPENQIVPRRGEFGTQFNFVTDAADAGEGIDGLGDGQGVGGAAGGMVDGLCADRVGSVGVDHQRLHNIVAERLAELLRSVG